MAVNQKPLSHNEELVLYGMVRFPNRNDRELAEVLKIKDSTVNYCRNQLEKREMFQVVYVPVLNRLGFEILSINFAEYNLKLSPTKRMDIMSDIESSNDIFLRLGEAEKEFSISFNKNYSEFIANTHERTEVMGNLKLITKALPENVVFSVNSSEVLNFFDYSKLLQANFHIDLKNLNIEAVKESHVPYFDNSELVNLSENDKAVFYALVDYPNKSIKEISELETVKLNRHTVSKLRERYLSEGLMKKIIIPNLGLLDYDLLVYYHFRFLPNSPITPEIVQNLNSSSTVLFFHNKYEAVLLSAFQNYSEYKEDKVVKYTYLNSHDILGKSPNPRKYVLNQIKYLRKFDFKLLSRKI